MICQAMMGQVTQYLYDKVRESGCMRDLLYMSFFQLVLPLQGYGAIWLSLNNKRLDNDIDQLHFKTT